MFWAAAEHPFRAAYNREGGQLLPSTSLDTRLGQALVLSSPPEPGIQWSHRQQRDGQLCRWMSQTWPTVMQHDASQLNMARVSRSSNMTTATEEDDRKLPL